MGNGINLIEILKQSFTLAILLFCSILSFTFMFERWWYFRHADPKGNDIISGIRKFLEAGNIQEAINFCQKSRSAIAKVIHYGLINHDRSRQDLWELLETKRQEEKLRLERFLGVLGTLGNISPFIGLFGTVVGIIKAFRDLALAGTGGPAVVARGIAEALVSTAAGLLVAIPAVIIYNYFTRRVKAVSVKMEVASTRLIVLLGAK